MKKLGWFDLDYRGGVVYSSKMLSITDESGYLIIDNLERFNRAVINTVSLCSFIFKTSACDCIWLSLSNQFVVNAFDNTGNRIKIYYPTIDDVFNVLQDCIDHCAKRDSLKAFT